MSNKIVIADLHSILLDSHLDNNKNTLDAFRLIWKMTEKNVELNTLFRESGKMVMNGVKSMVTFARDTSVTLSVMTITKMNDLIQVLKDKIPLLFNVTISFARDVIKTTYDGSMQLTKYVYA